MAVRKNINPQLRTDFQRSCYSSRESVSWHQLSRMAGLTGTVFPALALSQGHTVMRQKCRPLLPPSIQHPLPPTLAHKHRHRTVTTLRK